MKNKIVLLCLGSLLSVSCYIYFLFPPYYISAYLSKLSNSKNYAELSSIIREKGSLGNYSLLVTGDLSVRGVDFKHTPNEKEKISKLMSESNIGIILNTKDAVLFHIGEGEKSDIHFRVALLNKKTTFKKQEVHCENIIFSKGNSSCLFDLNQGWAILYSWVELN